jgi:hypothetical protein
VDVQLDGWFCQPGGVGAFEEAAEEPPLQADAVWEVEPFLVAPAVDLEPLAGRGGAAKSGEVAAGVQAKAGPVDRRQQRHRDLGQVCGAGLVELIIQMMVADGHHQVSPLGLQDVSGEGHRAGGQPAGATVRQPALPLAVLVAHDAPLVPQPGEDAGQDAAVVGDIAVEVLRPFPDDDGGQVRRLAGGGQPLGHRVAGDAAQAHLAGAPWLGGGPLDGLAEIGRLLRGEGVQIAR